MFTNYTDVIKVPNAWTDFDNERDELQQYIAEELDSGEKADKIINIIDNNWSVLIITTEDKLDVGRDIHAVFPLRFRGRGLSCC